MVTYLPRSAWRARPPNDGPGNLTVSRVQGTVIHWPGTGSTSVIHSQAAVASALRGWQNYHMDNRGWSDIAYQVAVDQAGRAWRCAGCEPSPARTATPISTSGTARSCWCWSPVSSRPPR